MEIQRELTIFCHQKSLASYGNLWARIFGARFHFRVVDFHSLRADEFPMFLWPRAGGQKSYICIDVEVLNGPLLSYLMLLSKENLLPRVYFLDPGGRFMSRESLNWFRHINAKRVENLIGFERELELECFPRAS